MFNFLNPKTFQKSSKTSPQENRLLRERLKGVKDGRHNAPVGTAASFYDEPSYAHTQHTETHHTEAQHAAELISDFASLQQAKPHFGKKTLK